jgi:hypothetical protein
MWPLLNSSKNHESGEVNSPLEGGQGGVKQNDYGYQFHRQVPIGEFIVDF